MFRRRPMVGYLRVPRGATAPVPVVVLFNGTNAVKEELHWWSEAFLARGLATLAFDGPGMGETFHRMSMVAEPRPMGVAILNYIETRPELDPGAVAIMGMSLGGHCAIRMAAHDPRVKAVAAVSPPFSVDVYWKVTLAGMRRELAGLYGIAEQEMEKHIDRITLANDMPNLACPMLVAGGGQDHITPGTEAWRIYDASRAEREIVYYPRGGHDCFNVMSDLRPRVVSWIARQLDPHRGLVQRPRAWHGEFDPNWSAAEAVDPDFAEALTGEEPRREWHSIAEPGVPVRWEWPWQRPAPSEHIEVVHRIAPAEHARAPWIMPA
jgi:2,6-dihydroxypseudooxynicotine hydrolase